MTAAPRPGVAGQTLGYHPSYTSSSFWWLGLRNSEWSFVNSAAPSLLGHSDCWLRAWGRSEGTGGPSLSPA